MQPLIEIARDKKTGFHWFKQFVKQQLLLLQTTNSFMGRQNNRMKKLRMNSKWFIHNMYTHIEEMFIAKFLSFLGPNCILKASFEI